MSIDATQQLSRECLSFSELLRLVPAEDQSGRAAATTTRSDVRAFAELIWACTTREAAKAHIQATRATAAEFLRIGSSTYSATYPSPGEGVLTQGINGKPFGVLAAVVLKSAELLQASRLEPHQFCHAPNVVG